ncbi:hypothetical protein GZ804_002053 [Escherichia coli]|nr:hypothetical protein [Escherichia coli]EFI3927681.1 hypothetical protein [Escherichia coli]EFI4179577.1 hypothetical protein [Escherichia coli]EFI4190125.1 hypothetical protein [Escherichia coli]EFI5834051.1 hypothetical protein [Escherichia coli]
MSAVSLNPSIFPLYMPTAASSLPTALLLSVLKPLPALVFGRGINRRL